MAKPRSELVVWARQDVVLPNTGRQNKKRPIDDVLNKGYDKGEKPAVEEFNYVLNMVTDWVRYLNDERLPEFEKELEKKMDDFKKDVMKEVDKVRNEMDQLEASINNKLSTMESFLVPAGLIAIWHNTTPPQGWLECNGQGFNVGQNPKLYQALGRGNVPDYRGLFLRGWAHGSGAYDPDYGRTIGSVQGDAIRNITGEFPGGDSNNYHTASFRGAFTTKGWGYIGSAKTDWDNPIGVFDASRVVPTAPENRPKNMAVMYIIKADSSSSTGTVVPTNITMTPDSVKNLVGYQIKATAQVLPVNLAPQYPITWTSQNPAVATVDGAGNIRIVGQGSTKIVASISTGMSSSVTVDGFIRTTSLSVSPVPPIAVNESSRLVVNRQPSNSTEPLIYSVSPPNVAAISDTGIVTGLSEGTAVVQVRTEFSGQATTVNVQITPEKIAQTLEDIQLGAVTIANYDPEYNQVPPGCVLVGTAQGTARMGYKPIQKKISGTDIWVTIGG